MPESLAYFMRAGGPAMWPLLLMSTWTLGIGLERMLFWLRLPGAAQSWLAVGSSQETLADGPTPRARLERWLYEDQERCLRGLAGVELIAVTAPMVGILGTVLGIIGAFASISANTSADPLRVSGGVSEALITTAFGLIIAISALFVRHIFGQLAEKRGDVLELEARAWLGLQAAGQAAPVGPVQKVQP